MLGAEVAAGPGKGTAASAAPIRRLLRQLERALATADPICLPNGRTVRIRAVSGGYAVERLP